MKCLLSSALAVLFGLASSHVAFAQTRLCAGVDREVATLNVLRRDALTSERAAINLRVYERLSALRADCASPWVDLHLALTEVALARWDAACVHLREALSSGDVRVERVRHDVANRALARVRMHTACQEEVLPPETPPAPAITVVPRPERASLPPLVAPTLRRAVSSGGSSPMRTTGYTLVGVGASALVAGLVFWGFSADGAARMSDPASQTDPRYRELWGLAANAGFRDRPGEGEALCRLAAGLDSGHGARTLCEEQYLRRDLALGLGISGAAIMLGGVILALASPTREAGTHARVAGWILSTGGAVGVEGRF